MEKPPTTKSINKILKLLPKVSQAAVSFQNPHSFSPRSDHHHHHHNKRLNSSNLNKGFSGTIIPNIPNQRSSKNNYENTQEPTSPKVSCMGQVKHKHKMCKQQQQKKKKTQSQKKALTKSVSYLNPQQIKQTEPRADSKKKPSVGMGKLFGSSRGRKSDASVGERGEPRVPDRAPSLSQMRRFASSRDTLADFDWTTARDGSDDDENEDDDVIIPFSAPLMVVKHGGSCDGDGDLELEPRKEINLWKRRTMAQPMPLRLDMLRSRSSE